MAKINLGQKFKNEKAIKVLLAFTMAAGIKQGSKTLSRALGVLSVTLLDALYGTSTNAKRRRAFEKGAQIAIDYQPLVIDWLMDENTNMVQDGGYLFDDLAEDGRISRDLAKKCKNIWWAANILKEYGIAEDLNEESVFSLN